MATQTINGKVYGTKEDAKAACLAYLAANPGGKFYNYATLKCVSYSNPEYPIFNSYCPEIRKYKWTKLYCDGDVVKSNPEMRGMFVMEIGEVR